MNLKGFEFRHIMVLDALFTECHVGRAAKILNLSQPAVSNALGWLRQHFDDPLLVRVGNALKLTPFAEDLRVPVRELVIAFRMTARARPHFDPREAEGKIRILMSHYEATLLLPEILKRIAHEAPNIEIDCLGINSDTNQFLRGEVDLLILNRDILHEEHGKESLFHDRLVCVGCAQAGWPDIMDRETYLAAKHIAPKMPDTKMPTSLNVISAIDTALNKAGIHRNIPATVPYQLIMELIRGTPLLATLPSALVNHSSTSGLRIFETPFDLGRIITGQQWHASAHNDARSKWLRQIVRDVVSDLHLPTEYCDTPEGSNPSTLGTD
ncbi:MAG: LysR family transcriptional regulator [Sphingobium sp.]|nr:LysR family transcriptional regulator [Sphingobium sp.]